MPVHFNYAILEDLSKGIGLNQIQHVFNTFISNLADYLLLEPLYQEIIIKTLDKKNHLKQTPLSILDFGIERIVQNGKFIINILLNGRFIKYLPFVLLREAYYCFIPYERSEFVQICINQIVENNLSKLTVSKDWKKLIRDSLVDKTFISSDLDRLQKFFKTEAKAPFESVTQFFFKEVRENVLLCQDDNIEGLYDIIFEKYAHKTSKSLFDSEIVETLRILIQLFYESKSYLNLKEYRILFKKYKEKTLIDTHLSLRKFVENMNWVNKCTSIAPSYDYSYSNIDLFLIMGTLKFNPLLEKSKIKTVIESWPFFYLSKFSTNNFALELSVTFHIPKIYLKDFSNYFNKMKEYGYIIEKKLYTPLAKTDLVNLNYYLDITNTKKIINPNNLKYKKKYEIEFNIEYPRVSHPYPLSIFEYTILERVRMVSVIGLTFDKRIETLNAIKEDIENELRKKLIINKEFKNNFDKIINSEKLRNHFLKFLEYNQNQGFLYVYSYFNQILTNLKLLEDLLDKNPEITNIYQFRQFLNLKFDSQIIEERLLFQNENLTKTITHDFLPLYFQSKKSFKEEIDKTQAIYDVLNACYNLKILELNKIKKILEEPYLSEKIYLTREKRNKDLFKPVSLYKITNEKIHDTINTLLNHKPSILKPMAINTILTNTFAKYYPEVILKDTSKVRELIKELKIYFPRIYIHKMVDLNTNEKCIRLLIYCINIREKGLFLSVLWSYFKESIILINRYFWGGVMRRARFGARDFYDFENGSFFYSENLYKQVESYSLKIFDKKLEWPKFPLNNTIQENLWPKEKKMHELIDNVANRITHQDVEFNLKDFDALLEFRKYLKTNLLNPSEYFNAKSKRFFKRYIKSIKFLPAFQEFGFSQYCLYFRPFYYKSPTFNIDFRLLFMNSFQHVKYSACIEPNPSIFIEYIFPFRKPNKAYLNWLGKSKKNVSEYCLFYKKKFYTIIHFNRNLTKEGWNYSSIRFKSYMQNVLFNPSYDQKISEIREFDINEKLQSEIYGYNTKEYDELTQVYNINSIDIKSFFSTRNYSVINKTTELLKKNLIYPYISLKNLDFEEKITIILPDTKESLNEQIIKIFGFFNVSRIYEIEGELYIYGFDKERSFENGLLIEIWFPKSEINEFLNIFDVLFQYLGIKYYIIMTDLVKGKTLLKSIYGNLDFFKKFNPLLNLDWNAKDKIWMNHKLFTEKFDPIYPDLIEKVG
jgi:hypothetical protein